MKLPLIVDSARPADNIVVLTLDIQPELPCFQGHFAVTPVLAGVVQIDWAIRLARDYFAAPLVFQSLQSVKFLRLVLPPLTVTLTLEYLPMRGLLKFSYRTADAKYSTGAIGFEPCEVTE